MSYISESSPAPAADLDVSDAGSPVLASSRTDRTPVGPAPGATGRRAGLRTAGSVLLWVAAFAVIAVLWPARFGGFTSLTVVSGESMEPSLHTRDLVVSWRSSSYSPGDVIVYKVAAGEPGAGHQVIHRIVAADPDGFYSTQGDNKSTVDPWHPTNEEVVGRAVWTIPGGARLVLALPYLLALVAGVLVTAALWPRRDELPTSAGDDPSTGDAPPADPTGDDPEADSSSAGAQPVPAPASARRRLPAALGVLCVVAVICVAGSSAASVELTSSPISAVRFEAAP